MVKIFRMTSMSVVAIYFYYYFEVGYYLFSSVDPSNFHYPLDINVKDVVQRKLSGEETTDAINIYSHTYNPASLFQCNPHEKDDLIILVQSPTHQFHHRNAVRETFGKFNLLSGVSIKTVFFIGKPNSPDLIHRVALELSHFRDIIQINIIDSEENATNKTMMVMHWVIQYCARADYYLFVRDDMYVSMTNLFKFLRKANATDHENKLRNNKTGRHILYAGHESTMYNFQTELAPFANFYSNGSKWWPSYITNGAYVLSNEALLLLYHGSFYVQHFLRDDVFLGIIAYKMKINLTDSENFRIKKMEHNNEYDHVIACQGYSDQEELLYVWHNHN